MRNHQTDPELIIWHYLRRKKVLNVTFNRQKPMYVYILDFYSDKAKLAIKIDRAQHFEPENLKNDQIRSVETDIF
ncbi:MAG: DUF559 domain-containing protein [Gammaproteobacteria bacterium]|nr:DUF559 domain-containing protein [Gammaproteobacteria bacterium]